MNSMKKWFRKAMSFLLVMTMVLTNFAGMTTQAHAEEATLTADGWHQLGAVASAKQTGNLVELSFVTGEAMQITVLTDSIFRLYLATDGQTFQAYPSANSASHTATITVDSDANLWDKTVPTMTQDENAVKISTDKFILTIDKATAKMKLQKADGTVIWQEAAPLQYKGSETRQTLSTTAEEYFYGGGTQNGRFSHKGEIISIVNQNNWVDQGVASPNPFYWSTKGYGVVRNTFQPGTYDFGKTTDGVVVTTHQENRFDAYYFVGNTPADLLGGYYTITGNPVELPEYAFYLAHMNAYNRDYWKEVPQGTSGAVKIGDKYWVESSTNNGGIQETLMGDEGVTAKLMIEEYKAYDMPLGWFLPNDGYGCGYGQTDSQAGDIANLKLFSDYAMANGIRTGLWTQANLWPADANNPQKGERDIYKEVDAGVTAVKTDVAWVGAGYSMALNGVSVAHDALTSRGGTKAAIVSLDGWAGTQRYAGIWTGDQSGGNWEYIRFHVPTYIGTSLSGQPNLGSDVDGIFGGKNPTVQTRDFQWKAFTVYMLDMDGWGSSQKTPWAMGEETTSINRAYLKLKAQLQPYINTISHEATTEGGLPMVRAMFLEEANDYTYGTATQYQYMWGDSFLVAPIYQDTAADANGNDIRNNIYLPSTSEVWIDYFTGEQYRGGQVLNDFDAPIWKLPVFVKNGSILPRYAENNNPVAISETNPDGLDRSQRIVEFFPAGETSFTQYEDDGITVNGDSATTKFTSKVEGTTATLTAEQTVGSYDGMVKERSTEFMVHVSKEPTAVAGFTKVDSKEAYDNATGKVYFYDAAPAIFVKEFATEGTSYANTTETTTPILYIKDTAKQDVTKTSFTVVIEGFANEGEFCADTLDSTLGVPQNLTATEVTESSITLGWDAVEGASYYEILTGDEILLGTISKNSYTAVDLEFKTAYSYRVRAVHAEGYSEWTDELPVETKDDPYRNVPEITAKWAYGDSWGALKNAFDHSAVTMFHSTNAVTAEQAMILDLKKAYTLDKFEYIPRNDNKGNGAVYVMDIYASLDGSTWHLVWDGSANERWTYDKTDMSNLDIKTVDLSTVTARYLKLSVQESAGSFFSAAELTVYKKDGDNGHLVGDTNNSNTLDENDLTFYTNYANLTTADSDWEYVSGLGNFNGNSRIDAYDVAFVAQKVGKTPVTTVSANEKGVSGNVMLIPSKTDIKAGDTVTVDLLALDWKNVYAFNVDFLVDKTVADYTAVVPGTKLDGMTDYSRIRKHSDETHEYSIFFSNTGDQNLVNTTGVVASFTLTAKQDFTWDNTLSIAMLVGKDLTTADATLNPSLVPTLPETKKTLTPGHGIVSTTFTNKHITDDVGDVLWQQPNWKYNLFDGNKASCEAEFKWYFGNDNITKEVMLPTAFQFALDGVQPVTTVTIYGRPAGNGTLQTSQLVAYNGEEIVYESGVVNGAQPVFTVNQNATRLVWTALTSTGTAGGTTTGTETNRMISLNEIEILTDSAVPTESIAISEKTPSVIYEKSVMMISADVSPAAVTNPFYSMTVSDESLAEIITIPTANGYSYALRALKAGTVTITATSQADSSLTAQKTITIKSGVDILELESAVAVAKALENTHLYSTATLSAVQNATAEAEEMLKNPTSQSAVDVLAVKLNNAIRNLQYMGSDTSRDISTRLLPQSVMSVVSATNYADADYKENVIDGSADTIWHSSYQSNASLPVEVVVDLGAPCQLEQVNYLPRQNSYNGHITQCRIEVSTDGETYTPVVVASFENDGTRLTNADMEKDIRFAPVAARYVKFIALKTLGNEKNIYASIAELNFYGTTNYNAVVLSDMSKGSVTASHKTATAGTEITLTATPAENYKLSSISVVDANGQTVELAKNQDKYTFVMPAGSVTVSATFALANVTVTPKTVTAVVEGSVIKLTGYMQEGESYGITGYEITDNTITDNGVVYTVDEKGVALLSTAVEVKSAESKIPTFENVSQEAKDAGVSEDLLNTLSNEATKTEGLNIAIANVLSDTVAEKLPEGADKVEVKVSMELKPTAYVAGESLVLDITPTVTKTYKTNSGDPVGDATVESLKKLATPVTISVKLPDGMPTTDVWAKHDLGNGKYEYLKVTVVDGVATWEQLTFSSVALLQDTRSATITCGMDTKTYTPADVGTALPVAEKSGYTFIGWKLNGSVVTAFTDELLTALNGQTVTAEAQFKKNAVPSTPAEVQEISFNDVYKTDYYYNAVLWAVKKGITTGTDAFSFSPNVTTTRAQMVTFLWRAVGSPVVNYAMNFTDVPADAYYTEAVRWAVAQGITNGTSATTFSPDASVTRAQAVTFLYRYEGSKSVNARNTFVDVQANDYFYDAVLWALEQKITNGTSDTTFAPGASCTRGQVVTFLYRDMVK